MTEINKKTAFITGASSGLGAEFALQLARQGYSLILTARREDRLNALAQKLKTEFGISVDVVVGDLTSAEDIARLEQVITDSQIDLLINNAGFGLNGSFPKNTIERLMRMIDVHVNATVKLTRKAIDQMIERKSGAVLNVASMAAFMAAPGSALYPATKAFLVSFSDSLAKEVSQHNIKVQALCPGLTYTEFHDTQEFANFERSMIPKIFWMSAEEVVKRSLVKLEKGKVVYIPGIVNNLFVALINFPLTAMLLWPMYKKKRQIMD